MALYETTFITRQDVSPQDVQKLADQYGEVITSAGGKVAKTEYWGLRSLAYRINKNRKGHYTMLCIDADSSAVNEIERQMRLNEDILRNLTVRVEAFSADPSPMLAGQDRSDSDEPRRHS